MFSEGMWAIPPREDMPSHATNTLRGHFDLLKRETKRILWQSTKVSKTYC